jgi:hypothetical protein
VARSRVNATDALSSMTIGLSSRKPMSKVTPYAASCTSGSGSRLIAIAVTGCAIFIIIQDRARGSQSVISALVVERSDESMPSGGGPCSGDNP